MRLGKKLKWDPERERFTNDDLANLLSSTDIATLFLDSEFRIKRFTPAVGRLFKLIATDVGRPLGDITHVFDSEALLGAARAVLGTLAPSEEELSTEDGRCYLRRILPYRTQEKHIGGVVITFAEVSAVKRVEAELRALNETLERRIAERTEQLALLRDAAVIANQAGAVEVALQDTLERILKHLQWPVGHALLASSDSSGTLVDTGIWVVQRGSHVEPLIRLSEQLRFKAGDGLVGRAIAQRSAIWIADVANHRECRRATVAKALGLKTTVVLPVLAGDQVVAMLELFTCQAVPEQKQLLEVMLQLGTQLGRVVERQRAKVALSASEGRYRALYDDNPCMYFTVNGHGEVLSVNGCGAEQLGYAIDELTGRPIWHLYGSEEQAATQSHLERVLAQPGQIFRREVQLVRRSGVPLWVRESARSVSALNSVQGSVSIPRLLLVFEDNTEAHHLADQVAHQAAHDALTGLVNRREFERRLERVLATTRSAGTESALCYLDLDQFKVINDTSGHAAGDELLRQLAPLLQERVRKRDTVARLGGDEFGVLMEHCGLQEARRCAEAIRQALLEFRFLWGGKHFTIGASIGLVPICKASGHVSEVLRFADAACYAAKDAGRNRIHVYRPEDSVLAERHGEMQWVTRLQQALDENRFQLCAQPIVAVGAASRNETHQEVLVRFVEKGGRLRRPKAFMPAAERYNLSVKLDQWVVEAALGWLEAHAGDPSPPVVCAINLSGQSVNDENFLEFLMDRLGDGRIPAGHVCFEVTETVAIANLAKAIRFMTRLKAFGCQFALDDFGVGFCSFSYLRSLPVDFLKIDGSFVKGILNDPVNLSIVRSINDLGHAMGIQTIAESVEDEALLGTLREIGVDFAQGYCIGRPQRL